jgi:molybdopterin synthase sulfur carrier subunit
VVVVVLPSLLAREAGGRKQIKVDAGTVGDALRSLPVADLLFDERGELRRLVNVYVDGTDVRDGGGVEATLSGGETVLVLQAVAGG